MVTSRADSWESTRQTFADQFKQQGTTVIYRRSQTGEAIVVSPAERDRFVAEFERNIGRLKWILYAGLTLAIGIAAAVSLLINPDLIQPSVFAAFTGVLIPYFAFLRWAWAAPSRKLAGRTPVARELSPDEAGRLQFGRLKYGQLALAALSGLMIPFIGSSRADVFSGWNRLWLVFGGLLTLFAAVQAFRKWRFESADPYLDLARPSAPPPVDPSVDDGVVPDNRIRRYLPLAAIISGSLVLYLTPVGRQLAQKPSFLPTLLTGFGCWTLYTVAQGISKGRIQPFSRGYSSTYQRYTQPKRFWASLAWNALVGGFFLWIGVWSYRDAGARAVQDQCYNEHDELSARQSYDACTKLIDGSVRLTAFSMGYAYDYRAIADERLGDRRRALADYTQAIRSDRTDEYAYLHRGLIFLDSMRLDQAVSDFTHAHRLEPKSPWPLADRGLAYAWKNDSARAQADFAAVRKVDPTNIVVLHGEGVLAMNSGNLESAVERFTEAIRQNPSDAWSIQTRADAYQQMGEFDKARADRQMLLEMSRGRPRA